MICLLTRDPSSRSKSLADRKSETVRDLNKTNRAVLVPNFFLTREKQTLLSELLSAFSHLKQSLPSFMDHLSNLKTLLLNLLKRHFNGMEIEPRGYLK